MQGSRAGTWGGGREPRQRSPTGRAGALGRQDTQASCLGSASVQTQSSARVSRPVSTRGCFTSTRVTPRAPGAAVRSRVREAQRGGGHSGPPLPPRPPRDIRPPEAQPQKHLPQLWSEASQGRQSRRGVPGTGARRALLHRSTGPTPPPPQAGGRSARPVPLLLAPGCRGFRAGRSHLQYVGPPVLGLRRPGSGDPPPALPHCWQAPIHPSESTSDGLTSSDKTYGTQPLFRQLSAPKPASRCPDVAIPTTQHPVPRSLLWAQPREVRPWTPALRLPLCTALLPRGRGPEAAPRAAPSSSPRCLPRASSTLAAGGLLPPSPSSSTDPLPGTVTRGSRRAQGLPGDGRDPGPGEPPARPVCVPTGGMGLGTTCPC